jgi:hypothetical protein
MCDGCSPPKKPTYQGKTLILEPQICLCLCPNVTFGPRGPRCDKCNHVMNVTVVGLNDHDWEGLWLRNGQPVRVDQARGGE